MINTFNNKIPEVSIIMPTFNRANLISESLNSILAQTFVNWECIIVDDGSTDNTKEILQPYLEKDVRFNYVERSSNYSKGPSGCRNMGIDLSKGIYLIYFDSDDIIHPENLQTCFDVISKGDYKFCRYDKTPFIGKWEGNSFTNEPFEIEEFSLKDIAKMVTMEYGFACCTVMWKKCCLNGKRFNEELTYAEEWEFYTRLLIQDITGASINKTLYYNRKHPNSNTGEFWNNDPVRRDSNLKAVKLVINNLSKKGLLSPNLVQYFISTGFFLKEISVIEDVLKYSNAGTLKRLKYLWGFRIYPVLKPFFNLKAKLKKS